MLPSNRYLGIVLAVFLSACAHPPSSPSLVASLSALKAASHDAHPSISPMRFSAVRDTALSLGARSGLYERSKTLNHTLVRYERTLERIFPFPALLLENNIIPPVLLEAKNTLEQSDPTLLRIADRAYSIDQQARFVTAIPSWRDYLNQNYEKPALPDKSLLPRDHAEHIIWEHYLAEGWQAGIAQANNIFTENVARLRQDIEGMIRYRVLLSKNMISAPYVAKLDMGITGGGSQMAINERLLQITALPQLQSESQFWDARVYVP
jgi:defect in organelle trafficking protein DotC